MTKRIHRFLVYPLAAAVPALGLAVAVSTGAGASTASSASAASSASKSAAAAAAAKAAIKKMNIGQHQTNHKTRELKSSPGLSQVQSSNWSGYADTGSGFTKVTSSWTEPTVSCASSSDDELAAFWVGIDGYSSSSVEQDGSLAECYDGSIYHYTWWEMYPTNDVQVVGQTAAPGDNITATVTRSGTSYTLAVTDSTNTADSFSTTQTCSNCANSSAEWIAEAPSSSSGVTPLANFGTWSTTGASATAGSTSGSISAFTDDEITMADSSNTVLAQPGSLSSDGSGFSVAWKAAS